MRRFGIVCGSGLLVAVLWLLARSDGRVAPVDGVEAEPRPASAPERPSTEADHAPLASSYRRPVAEKRTRRSHDLEPPTTAEPISDETDDTGEPVELAPFQERALERAKHDLVTVLEGDITMGVDMCATKLDGPPALAGRIELHIELGPHRGEASIESVSYGEDSEVDDPRLLECVHGLIAGEVIPAELLDETEGGVVVVRIPATARHSP